MLILFILAPTVRVKTFLFWRNNRVKNRRFISFRIKYWKVYLKLEQKRNILLQYIHKYNFYVYVYCIILVFLELLTQNLINYIEFRNEISVHLIPSIVFRTYRLLLNTRYVYRWYLLIYCRHELFVLHKKFAVFIDSQIKNWTRRRV